MSDAEQGEHLSLHQDSPQSITNGTSSTTFHSRGVTIKGPLVDQETENKLDQGARLTIHSSHGARNSAYGEGLRMVVDTPQAKNMIAWYDGFSAPGKIKAKAWIGYHYGTYPDIVHDHISIETPNEDGALHTRFGISTAPSAVTNIDFNMSDVQHTASQGGSVRLAVGGWRQTTYPRDLIFATGIDHSDQARRWAIRADTAKESGGNVGSTFRLVRYGDDGEQLSDKTMSITRSNGHVGVGADSDISWRINVESVVGGVPI